MRMRTVDRLAAMVLFAVLANAASADDLLPDLITDPATLGDVRVDTTTIPGRTLLRLSNMTANIGSGPLEVRAGAVVSPESQLVDQRIFDSDGGFRDRAAGTFTYHEAHAHVHFDDWAAYRLREVSGDGGVGAIAAEGVKTSFCLLDLRVYDPDHLALAPFPGVYTECDFGVQGISAGWADVYDRELPDQWIDITGLPLGEYWLESEVDPDDAVLEENEDNNVAHILISTAPPPPAVPDRYEENDSFDEVEASEVGAPGSPNLGAIEVARVLDGLSVEDFSDFFRFELTEVGPAGSHLTLRSEYFGRNINLALFTGDRSFVARSNGRTSFEQISLEGLAPGAYFARVFPGSGAVVNPGYSLEISVVHNEPPWFDIDIPQKAERWLERGFETLPVKWWAKDPDGSPVTVSLYIEPEGGSEDGPQPLESYRDLDAEAASANVNTALMELGVFELIGRASDSAAVVSDYARKPFAIYVKGDVTMDGQVDEADWDAFADAMSRSWKLPRGWRYILDMDRDGRPRKNDIELFIEAVHAHDHDDGSHEHNEH